MEVPKIKIRPSNKKIVANYVIKGQTKSQANIKKYFDSKERIAGSHRDSENKRISVNSGTVATTTSTNQKLRNVGSIGSLGIRKKNKLKLYNSKATEVETHIDRKQDKASASPDSDIHIDTGRRSKLPKETISCRPKDAKVVAKNELKLNSQSKYLSKIDSKNNPVHHIHGFGITFNKSGKNIITNSNKNGSDCDPADTSKTNRTMKGMKRQLEKLQNKYSGSRSKRNIRQSKYNWFSYFYRPRNY